jgi:biopolymer transport protein ExbD
VDTPKLAAVPTAQPQPRPDKPIFLTVKADHSWALGDDTVDRDTLAATLDQATGNDKGQRIFLRADKTVDYDTLMQTMNALRGAGYLKIALVGLDQSNGN